ncbi:putative Glucosamine 6-phosphate N-acetyltransferase [Monocercomonoides exilis]|uniref:putative Glucosamine 6-phosphate N-acetyltransferase n=1 Tax=Monocercomonoides exilis TaxID=2049356 RepID=UPI00355A8312|nr:putative Glucosamine 6-phosphate N-acetyltransferase [Monocercomonoides exilis]|eukprot:MONOS_13333.1-p1 / transcript=MONOS_13333.1 / gene=MONOS_13333 / organism=Monocercomonoides_exilis_PA203 / gene_product=Glucosamine 6-phosphate N-acetyltransferase, putative / transcript_product=Glucosamine 6-phosphate N-acetyltransferase, putative / location=Mono_scaffold00810:15442-16045(-) / protein_length=174 / sequence_SO=supercontig / SO=protein_coding / is_pseudo=false
MNCLRSKSHLQKEMAQSSTSNSSDMDNSEQYQIRLLREADKVKYLALLSQLTTVGEISDDQWKERFEELSRMNDTYEIWVLEEKSTSNLVACATLLIEKKFIHGVSQVGHIEEVVTDSAYRGKGLGKKLITHLIDRAKILKCYKVILDCKEDLIPFYASCGMKQHAVSAAVYFE